jgi:hypothetical protein
MDGLNHGLDLLPSYDSDLVQTCYKWKIAPVTRSTKDETHFVITYPYAVSPLEKFLK